MSLKSRVRPLVDRAAAATGALALAERRMRRGLTILMYHRILPEAEAAAYPLRSLAMPESAFREQVAWLARRCETLPLSAALAELRAMTPGVPRRRPLVAITFDDGYADNFERAAPILEENGLRGTFFLTTDLVEGKGPLWFDVIAMMTERDVRFEEGWGERRLDQRVAQVAEVIDLQARLRTLKLMDHDAREHAAAIARERVGQDTGAAIYRGMSPSDAADLARRGHEIGAHTVTHPLLPRCPNDSLRDELVRARALLKSWTGAAVTALAYPNGDHDNRVVRAARNAGYKSACTTRAGLNRSGGDAMRLRRIDVAPGRVLRPDGAHDELAFRSEIALLREALRRRSAPDTFVPAVEELSAEEAE